MVLGFFGTPCTSLTLDTDVSSPGANDCFRGSMSSFVSSKLVNMHNLTKTDEYSVMLMIPYRMICFLTLLWIYKICIFISSTLSIRPLKCTVNTYIYFFICARPELFCDSLQFDWLHERAAFYDILARGPKELFFKNKPRSGVDYRT